MITRLLNLQFGLATASVIARIQRTPGTLACPGCAR
jgi:hypothetical protein